MILSLAFMFGISAIAYDFSPWFWGESFSACAPMLVGLSITIPIWTIGEVIRYQLLLPTGRDREYTVAFVTGVIVNAIFNVLLIPQYSAMGAIIATIIAELVRSGIQILMARNEINFVLYLSKLWPYLVSGITMFVTVKYISYILNISLTAKIAVEVMFGVLIYFFVSCIIEMLIKRRILTEFFIKYMIKIKEKL